MRTFLNELQSQAGNLITYFDMSFRDNAAAAALYDERRLKERKGIPVDKAFYESELLSARTVYLGDFNEMLNAVSDMRCLLDLIEEDIKAEMDRFNGGSK